MEGRYVRQNEDLLLADGSRFRVKVGQVCLIDRFLLDNEGIRYQVVFEQDGQRYRMNTKSPDLASFKRDWRPAEKGER